MKLFSGRTLDVNDDDNFPKLTNTSIDTFDSDTYKSNDLDNNLAVES